MIKPNIDEIRMLTGLSCDNETELVEAAKELKKKGIEIVVISLGKDGSIVVCNEGVFRVKVPQIAAENTVGCGDSMIAGFALGFEQKLSMEECIRKASAISAASAMSKETGTFRLEDMEVLYPKIEIVKIEE